MLPSGPVQRSSTGSSPRVTPPLIVFETPDCGPCQVLRPMLDELAREFRHRVAGRSGSPTRAEGWLAARYHLSFVPTLLFCRDGPRARAHQGQPGPRRGPGPPRVPADGRDRREPAEGPRHTLGAPAFGDGRRCGKAGPRRT